MMHTNANGLGHTHTPSTHQKTCRRQSDGLWCQQSKRNCQASQSSHCPSLRGAQHHTNSLWIIQWCITLRPYLKRPFNSRCPQHGMTARILEHIQSMTYSSLQWPTLRGGTNLHLGVFICTPPFSSYPKCSSHLRFFIFHPSSTASYLVHLLAS